MKLVFLLDGVDMCFDGNVEKSRFYERGNGTFKTTLDKKKRDIYDNESCHPIHFFVMNDLKSVKNDPCSCAGSWK